MFSVNSCGCCFAQNILYMISYIIISPCLDNSTAARNVSTAKTSNGTNSGNSTNSGNGTNSGKGPKTDFKSISRRTIIVVSENFIFHIERIKIISLNFYSR